MFLTLCSISMTISFLFSEIRFMFPFFCLEIAYSGPKFHFFGHKCRLNVKIEYFDSQKHKTHMLTEFDGDASNGTNCGRDEKKTK